MKDLILEPDQFIRSFEISKNDVFSVFLGAGASITSGIPSATDCMWDWKKNLYTSKHSNNCHKLDIKSDQVKIQIQKWLDSEGLYPVNESDDEYSFYVEECYPIEDDRRKFFQRICEKKQPSIGYKLLCLLHEMGIIQSVWTTNFDDLGIHAAIAANLLPIEVTLDTVDRIIRPQNNGELPFIKLHGDYKYGPLKNTSAELAKQDTTFRNHLVTYLNDKHLIVSGYSGRDNSIMDALMASYSQKGAGRIYWCGYGRYIPSKVVQLIQTARENGRTAYYIPTDGFDKIFISLASSCTKDNDKLTTKFREYLSVSSATTEVTKFSIPQTRVDTVIKSNLFQIGFPQEVFQFEFPFQEAEKPWSLLRSMTANQRVVAVPFKQMVYAIGTLTDINRIFSERMKGKITRIPLAGFNLQKDTAFHNLLLSGITDLLSSNKQLPNNKRDLIWKNETTSQIRIDNVIYQTHSAIRLSINTDNEKYYLSFMPDFHVTSETEDGKIGKEVYQEIGRTYFEKIWNSKFNEYIKDWRALLFPLSTSIIEMEYPLNSGSGLIFKISRDNAFAGIMMAKPGKVAISPEFPRKLIHHRGIQYSEPELIFAPKIAGMTQVPRDFHPMRGLTVNKPYDFGHVTNVFDSGIISLGVVCSNEDAQKFKTFLSRHLTAIDSASVNKAYLLSFPGFQAAFATQLIIPDPGTDNWAFVVEPTKLNSIKSAAADLRNHLIGSIENIMKDGLNKVVVIYIPKRWLEYTSYDIENEHYDLHDYLKAYCAERGIATQFIQEDTLSDLLQCQINWWLSFHIM